MKIEGFLGEYKFLSNFYPVDVELDGVFYPSTEHAFQAAKTLDPAERAMIKDAIGPGVAKRLGREVKLRPDWNDIRVEVMRGLVTQKFREYPVLKRLLLDTGDAELVEKNHWHDSFWGICQGRGENWLGRILMDVRAELRRIP